LLKVREVTLELQGSRPEQRADLEVMEQLAVKMCNVQSSAYTAFRRSYLALRTADWSTMESQARLGMQLAQQAGDNGLRLRCLRLVADARATQGDMQIGQQLAQEALVEARTLGLSDVQALCLNTLGFIAYDLQGDTVAALELDQQALTIANETGDRRGVAIGLGNLGIGWINLGALTKGRKLTEEALQVARTIGDRTAECNTLGNLSQLALWQAEDTRALSFARAAYEIALAVEARNRQSDALVHLGNAELALGRLAQAHEAYVQAHEEALSIDHPRRHDAQVGLARVAMAQGNLQTALLHVNQLLEHAESGGNFEGVDQARLLELTCHQVLEAAADSRATHWLDQAYTQLQTTADTIADSGVREGFLSNIPHHREIVATWERSRPT
jgi:tetratricopeptide (TPR) repeat protein